MISILKIEQSVSTKKRKIQTQRRIQNKPNYYIDCKGNHNILQHPNKLWFYFEEHRTSTIPTNFAFILNSKKVSHKI